MKLLPFLFVCLVMPAGYAKTQILSHVQPLPQHAQSIHLPQIPNQLRSRPELKVQTLIIGTTANYPPFASMAGKKNNFVGFEIDLMEEICKRIHVHCEYRPVVVSQLPKQLLTDKIDLAVAAIIIPSQKMHSFIFSLPYLQSNAELMTEKDSSIDTPTEIRHKKVGVRRGTLYNGSLLGSLVRDIYDNQVKIIEYPTMTELLFGLKNDDVDAIFANAEAVKYWFVNNKGIYKIIGSTIPVGNGYGIMGKKGQEKLMAKINHALLTMEADDSYLNIYSRYFM